MEPYLNERFGNPSSIHQVGREARSGIDTARRQVAQWLGCHPGEVVFTSGATEAIHAALVGAWLAGRDEGRHHIITTAVEHHAVLDTCAFLRELGVDVTVVKPGPNGVVSVGDVVAALRPDTLLVSVMAVNNETGAVQPVQEIARRVKSVDDEVLVHSDLVQMAAGAALRLNETSIDLASVSAHKIYGPKGVGALFIRRGTRWQATLHGGAQERARRAGTENVPGIVGFGAAAERLYRRWDAHVGHLRQVRDAFWWELSKVPDVRRNSPPDAAPGILNVAFPGLRNETLLMRLDLAGVAASAGSACTAGTLEPSHVLIACGQTEPEAREAVRFSFSEFNTVDEVREAARIVRHVVTELR
jgi:cysteine desulfurase